jgi:hypothetical protein
MQARYFGALTVENHSAQQLRSKRRIPSSIQR